VYLTFEKLLAGCVIFMTLCFAIVLVMVAPDYGAIARGLVPRIPPVEGAMGLVAAMAGTTCSAAVFVIRSIVVAEKGWKTDDLPRERRDAAVSAAVMLLLSGTVMAVAAGTLHVKGYTLNDSVELIRLFEPLGGPVAAIILICGVTAAGISTVFPIALIAPWLIADFSGKPRDLRSPMFRILGLGALLLAFVSQFLEQRPPAVMIFSQAFQAFILPAVVIPILYLLNRREVMGEHRATIWMNLGLVATLLFSFLTAFLSVVELFHTFV
jgi:Mn2+/Fe2+ NRAMP family transporter